MVSETHLIKAFRVGSTTMPLQPAVVQRDWMLNTPGNFANRCLPLRIANQFGWFMLNGSEIEVTWNGEQSNSSLKISRRDEKSDSSVFSHFGQGILTWQVPYLFRTPPGYNLYVRGPTNFFKDGAFPLDGVIETDWSVTTFTMNWKITRVGVPIHFGVGEPIGMIMPVARGELEKFEIMIEDLRKDPVLQEQYNAWAASRREFNQGLVEPSKIRNWQKHYFFGKTIDESVFQEHQTALDLKPVVDPRAALYRYPPSSQIVVRCPDAAAQNGRRTSTFFQRLMKRLRGRTP